ncbi:hypothetical protein [Sphingosinithalassobacter portus]|uniref:hypothetical protein n=1 Tax=Stakelama portus TaxID=2676234 RepID=UPI000D6E8518|nr:hypothetical protein [Sphingosinithalassobacter portus]
MTRIGGVDQILLMLRAQLQRAEKQRGSARSGRAGSAQPVAARPIDRIRALAAMEDLDERHVRRLVVRAILTEEFGEAVANDAAFQKVIEQVVTMLGEDERGRAAMQRAIVQLGVEEK